VHSGAISPVHDEHALFAVSFPWELGARVPERVRLDVWGYGGTGYRFVDIVSGKHRYVPTDVKQVKGRVTDPEHLLADDDRWSYLGEPDVYTAFHSRALHTRIHSVELAMGEGRI